MSPKLFEGLSLIVGLCVCMYALFNSNLTPTSAPVASTPPKRNRKAPLHSRAAYLLAGSSLLAYGLAEVLLRSAS